MKYRLTNGDMYFIFNVKKEKKKKVIERNDERKKFINENIEES